MSSWLRKNRDYVMTAVLLLAVFLIYTPIRIIHDNYSRFSFPIGYAAILMSVIVIGLIALYLVISLCLGRKIKEVISVLCFIFAICLFVNGEVFNDFTGILQGYTRYWPDWRWKAVIGGFLWIFTIAVGLLAYIQFGESLVKILNRISLILTSVLVIASIILVLQTPEADKGSYATNNNIEIISEDKNIFIFVLDRLDGDYVKMIKEDDPDFFNSLEGFTYYPNATSVYARTYPTFVSLLSGDYSAFSIPFSEYSNTAWDNQELFPSLAKAGYQINYYDSEDMNLIFGDTGIQDKYFNNFSHERQRPSYSWLQTIEKMVELSIFRDFPSLFQPFFEESSDSINGNVVIHDDTINAFRFYSGSRYLNEMEELSIVHQKQFKLFHTDGAHLPYTYDENGRYTAIGTTPTQEARWNLKAVMHYLELLKRYGVYDNSTIFIIADHGARENGTKSLEKPTTIAFFYKPAYKTGYLEESTLPVSLKNIVPTILDSIGCVSKQGDPPIGEMNEENVVRNYVLTTTTRGIEDTVYEYEIIGDARNRESWSNTSVWKIGE